MSFIQGWDRHQEHLLPPRVEDYVAENNSVRFLDVFVEQLDMAQAGFAQPHPGRDERGRPGYRAADLLKLYLYGYLHQIRSSRRLEQECRRNLEVIWLLRQLAPDFKTIADFRKNNAAAFKGVVRQFTVLCRNLDLFGRELLAIDGTRIKGQNAKDRNWSQSKLEKQLKVAEEKAAAYLASLEQTDAHEIKSAAHPTTEELQEKIKRLAEKKEDITKKLRHMAENGVTQLSATDPDSRGMRSSSGHIVGYNVQGAADSKHHLLAVLEVTNQEVDRGQLIEVAKAAKEALDLDKADVVADGGYYKDQDIKACQDLGLEPHVAEVNHSPSERRGLYGKDDFRYDAASDTFQCPAGQTLKLRSKGTDRGKVVYQYANPAACERCPLRSKCTEAPARQVSRWEHHESIERMKRAKATAPEKLQQRKLLIEHPWGTIKWLLPGGFLVRGLKKVAAEVSLVHWAYNFKRALAVVGLEKLMAALRAAGGLQPMKA